MLERTKAHPPGVVPVGRAPDHSKISFTAKLVALGRAQTDLPFAKEISELVGAPALAADLSRAARQEFPPQLVAFTEARYKSIESALKASGIRQVLEFASGISFRGLAMTLADPSLVYIETDLPDLNTEKARIKQTLLAKHKLSAPATHHVLTANILNWSEIERAMEPLLAGQPVAVVHEGLFMYLTAEEKEIATSHIRRVLERFGGVWMTPDFTSLAAMHWMRSSTLDQFSELVKVIEARTQRRFEEHTFANEAEVRALCDRFGFKLSESSQIDGSYTLSSLGAGGEQELQALKEHLLLWQMRLSVGASRQ